MAGTAAGYVSSSSGSADIFSVASGVLSHYCKAFLRVASWMLLSIGVINMALGFMREKAKVKRSFSFENVANA